VTLVIADDGKGFDTHTQRAGNGLYTMEERARILNGSFNMQSSPGQGTVITLRFKTT
jgi:signal transduction histidine kinase